MKKTILTILAAFPALAVSLSAATFTVSNTNMTGAGSLQQAILDANANPGADVITFNMPADGLTITPTNALPTIVEPVEIDGSTQPGFAGAPIIELNGASAGAAADGLKIATSNSIIRALVINRFLGDGIEITNGTGNKVEGCYLGLNLGGLTDQGNTLNGVLITNGANNTIGGLAVSNRNYIAGNNQNGVIIGGATATNNLLLGNVIGLNVAEADIGNSQDGVRVVAPLNVIGGGASGARNVISGNASQGIEIGTAGVGTIVRGNHIGADSTGAIDRGNSADGILVSAGGVIIGGSNVGEGNLISGNGGDGVELNGASATNNIIHGNIIGATISGTTALLNGDNGVLITTSSRSNIVGGVTAGAANLIAFNVQNGISVAAAAANTNNVFRGNSIFANTDLGINLGAAGITANDAGDADTGANELQNYPVLATVTNTPSGTIIAGTISSRASTTYTIDFYSSVAPNPLGHGEGQTWMGATNLTTDAAGVNNFNVSLPVVSLAGRYVSATATDPFGNTSEFSTNVMAGSIVAGQNFTVMNTNDSGPGSLRQAIINANANISAGDTIQFAITNLTTTVSPASALPAIIDPVTIDGYTQPGAVPNTSPTVFNGVVPVRISGSSAGSGVNGLVINIGYSTVRGLMITGFNSDGIELSGSSSNVIQGCLIGLDATGADQGNNANGIFITGSSNNIIGGTTLAARNVISGNNSDGVEVNGATAINNWIANNLLGTDQTGTLDCGNSGEGIVVTLAGSTRIGGSSAGEGNLISGNAGYGVELSGVSATANLVLGNTIGLSATNSALRNTGSGVHITSNSRSNIIGGITAGAGNRIAFHGARGIIVDDVDCTNNTFRGNSIYANSGLGIDLSPVNATLNDANDADVGPNQLQNFPVIASVQTNVPLAQIKITGSLASAPNTAYDLDFYANSALDSLGHGEGEFYLGSTNVTTDGSGNASYALSISGILPGRYLSATATDPYGNTSEFSRWIVALNELPSTNVTVRAADFVFIIDGSASMSAEIAAVKNGLGNFVASLNTSQIDARFAVVLFGGAPEVILDFTSDQGVTEAALDVISVNGALPGVHNNHNLNPEEGLEAIRIVLNSAVTNALARENVGGSGPLAFRPEARKNLILVTDENSDQPFFLENRQTGQTNLEPPSILTAAWQTEVDLTAQAVITNEAFINMLIDPSATPSINQYGDPVRSVSSANFLNFNPTATLSNLVAAGNGNCLEAQVLAAGLIGRAFNISSVNTTNFIENFFAAKVEEIVNASTTPPRLSIAPLLNSVRLTWTTNAPGYQLETNHSLLLSNNWGMLTTNYSVIGTNYAVTNAVNDATRFYRLRK